jgi:hypothetical protein
MSKNSNIYHRYLNLPFTYPKPERFNHSVDNYNVLIDAKEIHGPFKEWIQSHGLTIPLHADTGYQRPGDNDICKLNFTWGPLDSTTRWYKVKDDSKLINHKFGKDASNKKFYDIGIEPDIDISHIWIAEWEDVDLVYEAVIDRPSLLNISQLHSTWNPSPTEHRWTLCFTLLENKQPLTFNRALEIFGDYMEVK